MLALGIVGTFSIMAAKKSTKAKGALDQEQIVLQFNQMRQECRNIMSKIGELEMDSIEHRYRDQTQSNSRTSFQVSICQICEQ